MEHKTSNKKETANSDLGAVIASAEFEKDLEKAIEEGNEVGYNADGGYNYYCEGTALREVLKVIKKHLL